jgi:hypothetical protein
VKAPTRTMAAPWCRATGQVGLRLPVRSWDLRTCIPRVVSPPASATSPSCGSSSRDVGLRVGRTGSCCYGSQTM